MQFTIEINNTSDLTLALAFLERIGAKILEKEVVQKQVIYTKEEQSPVYWLEKLAKQGGIRSIQNPSEWQREQRKDRDLPFRENN